MGKGLAGGDGGSCGRRAPDELVGMMMDEFDIIETPENVDLQRRLAGIGSRFVAGLLDTLLMVGVLSLLVLVSLFFGLGLFTLRRDLAGRADQWVLAWLVLLVFLVYWGYFVLFETWMNGQTPGKRYMRIRVVQLEGGGVSFQAVAIRNLLRAVDILGGYAVAGLAMFLTTKVQRLGDLAAGTVVISEEVPDYAAQADKKEKILDEASLVAGCSPAGRDEVPGAGDVRQGVLRPQEYRLLQNYWLRRDQLSLDARVELLPKLLRPILERLGMPPTEDALTTLEWRVAELLRQSRAADASLAAGRSSRAIDEQPTTSDGKLDESRRPSVPDEPAKEQP
jgi:uncharacterized RDD family membrane protein YckC